MTAEPIDVPAYCRDIEAFLCRKNDGHLIRVVGPSFELVARWATDGVPLNVAFQGIDRYFERYYRKGARRRPVKIDFCEADVLDVFDEWRRATGVVQVGAGEAADTPRKGGSLPEHLTRVLTRLTQARVKETIGPPADPLIAKLSEELDRARASSGGVRGDARKALLDRLAAIDRELLEVARDLLPADVLDDLEREADVSLQAYRAQMAADAFARARQAALDALIRTRLQLPTVTL